MLDFLGVGAQKSGTSWLHEMLARHPDIQFPTGKEIHFWDLYYDKGLDWYLAHFEEDTKRKQGEITPAYAILSRDKIAKIAGINPSLRLMFIMRDPIARAWSAALMAIPRAELKYAEASDQWFIDHFYSEGSLKRGDYEQCIRNWLEFFPEEQLLLLQYEDIKKRPRALLSAAARHIGVDNAWSQTLPKEILSETVIGGPGIPLRPSLLPVLEAIYCEKIAKTEDYIKNLNCPRL